VYKLLSSPVNAICRTGNPIEAFDLLYRVDSPDQLLNSVIGINAKGVVKKEIKRVLGEFGQDKIKNTVVIKDFLLLHLESDLKITGRIATEIRSNSPEYTVIVVNTARHTLSGRGELSLLLVDLLRPKGYKIGGHPGFIGATLDTSITFDKICEDIREGLRSWGL